MQNYAHVKQRKMHRQINRLNQFLSSLQEHCFTNVKHATDSGRLIAHHTHTDRVEVLLQNANTRIGVCLRAKDERGVSYKLVLENDRRRSSCPRPHHVD